MGGGGPSGETERAQREVSERQTRLAEREEARAAELHGISLPWLKTAGSYYETLASGDPNAIFRQVAPAIEGITTAGEAQRERIRAEMPRGGEARLAEEQSKIAEGGQVGSLITQSYTSAFPALASLAGRGLGLSINEMANAIAAFGGAGQTLGQLGSQEAAGKAATMGFLGSVVESGAGLAAAACWIAELLFGRVDWRTHLVRRWLNRVYARTPAGAVVVLLYRLIGRQVAWILARARPLQRLFRPLFAAALRRAVRELAHG